MRVVLVIQKLAGLRGGAERVVIELALALAARGHTVTLATYEPSVLAPGYDTAELEIVDLFPKLLRRIVGGSNPAVEGWESVAARRGNGPIAARLKWTLTHGLFARRLARWLRRARPDVVVGFLPPAISAVGHAGERLGSTAPRLIASTHNVPNEDFGPNGRWDSNPIARRENLRALTIVDAVTILQPEFVAQLPEAAQPIAVVMPNAVSRLAPPTGADRDDVIIGVGRLTDVKRFDVLVGAFARIADELPDWRMAIYGDGPERGALESLVDVLGVGDKVDIHGVTTDLASIYDAARIVCHPARFEGFGLAVAEAIMHGVPVVASQFCPGVVNLVEPGATGVLVDDRADPVEAFAEALLTLAREPIPIDRHRVAADQLADRLAPERIYDAWETLLRG